MNPNTVQYIGTRLPPVNVDVTKLYDGTVTHMACLTTDSCHVKIPFVGTGINVYNVIRTQLNISFAIDGDSSTPYIHGWNRSCFSVEIGEGSVGNQGCYNTSVYNVQSLTYANHTLDIAMFSWTGSTMNFGNYSDYFLDYAVISSPISASITSSSQRSHKRLAAAIGGALGGIIVIVIILAVIYKARSSRRTMSIPRQPAAPSPGSPQTASSRELQNVDARQSAFTSVAGHQFNVVFNYGNRE